MKSTKVQYTVKKEFAKQNASNIQEVMNDLQQINNRGIRYSSFMLDDKKSFVHFAIIHESADDIFNKLPSFKKFQDELNASKPEIPPKVEHLSLVASSYNFFNEIIEQETLEIITQFNLAFQKKDPTLLHKIVDTNCVMEGSMPPPDGITISGYESNIAFWTEMIDTLNTQFSPESVDIAGEKATIKWKFMWGEKLENHIRGVSLATVRNKKILEVVAYIKGELK